MQRPRTALAATSGQQASAADVALTAPAPGTIRVIRNPSESDLSALGVTTWGTWGCEASTFPWTYDAHETCYILKGEVTVTPAGSSEGTFIQAGDLATFPKGMSCTWAVTKAINKHYYFF